MPFPSTPIILTGSCNCNAIHYQISIPSLSSRPVQSANPNHNQNHHHLIDLPLCASTTTNPNTSNILLTPAAFLNISLPPRSHSPHLFLPLQDLPEPLTPTQTPPRRFHPAIEVLTSSKCRSLSIQPLASGQRKISCSRCGTHLFTTATGQTSLLEIPLSTIKTEGTQEEWLVPECGVYWDTDTLRLISVGHAERSSVFEKYGQEKSGVQVGICEGVSI